jgi:hypothetical protein
MEAEGATGIALHRNLLACMKEGPSGKEIKSQVCNLDAGCNATNPPWPGWQASPPSTNREHSANGSTRLVAYVVIDLDFTLIVSQRIAELFKGVHLHVFADSRIGNRI